MRTLGIPVALLLSVSVVSSCTYKYERLSQPFEESVALAERSATEEPLILRVTPRGGTDQVTLRFHSIRGDTLIGLNNADSRSAEPDTLRFLLSLTESIEHREAGAGTTVMILVGTAVVAGATFVIIASAGKDQWDETFKCCR